MRIRTRWYLVPLVPFFVACTARTESASDSAATATPAATPAADPVAVRAAIDSANVKWEEAVMKGDAATISSFFTDDGKEMSDNQPTVSGRAAIQDAQTKRFSQETMTNVNFTTESLDVQGDLAVETGSYEMTVQRKGGKAAADKGKYVTVWKRQSDGSWRVYRDISNSDLPAPK